MERSMHTHTHIVHKLRVYRACNSCYGVAFSLPSFTQSRMHHSQIAAIKISVIKRTCKPTSISNLIAEWYPSRSVMVAELIPSCLLYKNRSQSTRDCTSLSAATPTISWGKGWKYWLHRVDFCSPPFQRCLHEFHSLETLLSVLAHWITWFNFRQKITKYSSHTWGLIYSEYQFAFRCAQTARKCHIAFR